MSVQKRKTDLQPGQRFEEWTVLEKVGVKNKSKQAFYLCRCSCGTEKEVNGSNLRTGASTCCGCNRQKQYFYRDIFSERGIDKDQFLDDLGKLYIPELEKKYSISRQTITRYRKKFDITPPKESAEETYKVRLITLHEQGLSVKEISEKFHQNAVYVYNRLRQLGLSPNYVIRQYNIEAMSSADRSTRGGFKFYWSNRQIHFEELYGMPYNPVNAARVFESL